MHLPPREVRKTLYVKAARSTGALELFPEHFYCVTQRAVKRGPELRKLIPHQGTEGPKVNCHLNLTLYHKPRIKSSTSGFPKVNMNWSQMELVKLELI